MFRKLVSNLPFSPALVGQLGFYARRLRKEEATRRLGLIFTALALVVQSLAVFSPPEPANAASDSDFIRGGVRSMNDVLAAYDQSARGQGDYKQIMDYAGITREEIAAMKEGSVNSKQFGTGSGAILSWGRVHRFSSAEGEVKHVVPRSNDASSTVFSRPLWRFDSKAHTIQNGSTYQAYIGYSAKIGWFAISKDCANLFTQKTPNATPQGKVIKATCDVITGYAFDARNPNVKTNVFVYFGGPPGKGERVGPVLADNATIDSPAGKGYGFSIAVPEKYKRSPSPTEVFGVMVPLPGWNDSSLQIGSAKIPGNCIAPTPVAECINLKTQIVDRTKASFVASARVANGATISSYVFTVKDAAGKVIATKEVSQKDIKAQTEAINLGKEGTYTIDVAIKTSQGVITGPQCTVTTTVVPPAKCPLNPSLLASSSECQPCPGDASIWIKDKRCEAVIAQGKEVRNLTQNIDDANNTTAKAGDRIEYSIYAENTGLTPATVDMKEELADVLEYASLQNLSGGQFDDKAKVLNWGTVTLQPNEKHVRKFVVQVLSTVPATPQGTSEPGSYDCIMSNSFGNNTTLNVECPAAKVVESAVKELPHTGPGANAAFGIGIAMVVTYFYARTRQLNKEVRLIRHDFNAGTI
ncbi:hypothetical protein CYG49_04710 [Candidatus Saccharibacteria bacterium]|nr:MAG: hypothetical protein CYG49_04710 [Candidatus Saccharibacteria bacterium]